MPGGADRRVRGGGSNIARRKKEVVPGAEFDHGKKVQKRTVRSRTKHKIPLQLFLLGQFVGATSSLVIVGCFWYITLLSRGGRMMRVDC